MSRAIGGSLAELPEKLRRAFRVPDVACSLDDVLPVQLQALGVDLTSPGFATLIGRRWAMGWQVTGAGAALVGVACPTAAPFGVVIERALISVTAAGPLQANLYGPTDTAGTAINNTGEAVWVERVDGSFAPVLTESATAATAGGVVVRLGRLSGAGQMPIELKLDFHLVPGARLWLNAAIVGDFYCTLFGRLVASELG